MEIIFWFAAHVLLAVDDGAIDTVFHSRVDDDVICT